MREQWDGLRVCDRCYEERHPQEFVTGVEDQQAAAFVAPEPADVFQLAATVQGVTTATLAAGPENLWDNVNTLRVQTIGGAALSSASELQVLNGANLCAVQGGGGWEILQYQTASLTSPSIYALTGLLRGRYGTELAMGAPSGSPFVFIGQSDASTPAWLRLNLGVGYQLRSPVNVTATMSAGGDTTFQWVRRSTIPRLDVDDWTDAYFGAALDSDDERYEVDVLNGSGAALRTLRTIGQPRATYSRADHLSDWGALQASLTVRVYQTDQVFGRGPNYRQATVSL